MRSLLFVASLIFCISSIILPAFSESTKNGSLPGICPIALTTILKPSANNPTCSLSSQPVEPAPELLSFEEWRAKQFAERDAAASREKDSHSVTTSHVAGSQRAASLQNETSFSNKSEAHQNHNASGSDSSPSAKEPPVEVASSPKFHIPLIDRFNYASNECNARIQSHHKSAKSASSILSRKKDRYMLSPCQTNKESHSVIVELCEDIRIDTVQLANFEFFSGVFKDIRVSVAHTYTSDGQGWVLMGEYTAKNIRGVQSFHPQKELLPFYRYIRIDFLSYYGNEYFCPISLLRVYGLTQMEEWKSDVWKAEWEAVQPSSSEAMPESTVIALEGRPTSLGVNETPGPNPTKSAQIVSDRSNPSPSPSPLTESIGSTFLKSSSSEHVQAPTPDISDTATPILPVEPIETIVARSVPITTSVSSTTIATSPLSRNEADTNAAHLEPANISPETPPQSTQADTATKEEENLTPITSLDLPVTTSAGSMTSSGSNQNPPAESPQTVTRTISTTIVLSAASPSGTNTALIPSGESVYRMIINRLNGLETNQTLYAKYFEEQGKIVSVRMKRLEEDLGRLSGIVSSHQQHVSKLLERHRLDLESEHQKLALQVESLAHEVLMEKRIGLAQLVILVAVLVFMALTRGSRGEPIRLSRASAAWNRGVRSSGEWVAGWRGSRSIGAAEDLSESKFKPNEPTTSLQPAFTLSSSKGRPASRSRRSSSSQRSFRYEDLLQTPPRPSRHRTRSRHSSLRSRGHTPVRQPARNEARIYDLDSPPGKAFRPLPLGNPNTSDRSGTLRPSSSTSWRPGRSISLTNYAELNGPFGRGGSTSSLPGTRPQGIRKLAKTAHMHEVKNRSRRGTADEGTKSLLSPMMEDLPVTATSMLFSDEEKEKENAPLGSWSLDTKVDETANISLQNTVAMPNFRELGVGVPFPSPDPEGTFHPSDEDHWVDETGDEERPSPSPILRTKRNLSSSRRLFGFSMSPTKGRFKSRHNDAAPGSSPAFTAL